MKCELCHQNNAETVLYRQTDAGAREELYVCESCAARERAFEQQHGIQVAAMDASPLMPPDKHFPRPIPPELEEKLMGLSPADNPFFGDNPERPDPQPDDLIQLKTCPHCGIAEDEVQLSLHLGCAHCYDVFREELKVLFKDLQGCTSFHGKPPAWLSAKFQLRDLKRKLQEAIEKEQFDEAKKLMQALRALESSSEDNTASEDTDEA